MKFWKVLVILLCVILLLIGLIVAGIGVGIHMLRTGDRNDVSIENNENSFNGSFEYNDDEHIHDNSVDSDVVPPETSQPEENLGVTDREELSKMIIGSWVTAYRSGDTIYSTYYEFAADGTYYAGGCEYMHVSKAPDLFGDGMEGWQTVPMGFPYEHGTYTVRDGYIEIVCEGNDYESYVEPFVARLEISEYDGISAVFVTCLDEHISEPKKFVKDFDYEKIEELCEALGVDITP